MLLNMCLTINKWKSLSFSLNLSLCYDHDDMLVSTCLFHISTAVLQTPTNKQIINAVYCVLGYKWKQSGGEIQ